MPDPFSPPALDALQALVDQGVADDREDASVLVARIYATAERDYGEPPSTGALIVTAYAEFARV